jgi:trehalose/maltose hydrolase-like predicted phosphorylase
VSARNLTDFRDVAGVIEVAGADVPSPSAIARRAADDRLPTVIVTEGRANLIHDPRSTMAPPTADGEPGGLSAAFRQLGALGIGPGLVAVVGGRRADVAAVGGGRALMVSAQDFEELLAARSRGHDRGRVPDIDEDPQWTIVFDGFPITRSDAATVESMTTLANGEIGVRGVYEDDGEGSPMVAAPGVFDDRGDTPELLAGPNWTSLVMLPAVDAADRRVLDMRTGMLLRERTPHARAPGNERRAVRTLRFVPLEQGPCGVLLAEGPLSAMAPGLTFHLPHHHAFASEGREVDGAYALVAHEHGGIAAFGHTRERQSEGIRTLERVVAFAVDGDVRPSIGDAREAHEQLRTTGVDDLVAAHRAAWARRWADAEVSIEGDAEIERSARFAVFHLLSSVSAKDEAAVGPRGLSGTAYGGHVLWDADIYVLPALAATFPDGARAMVEYRVRRLEQACRIAKRLGFKGARFPWESGRDGSDITPRMVRRSGQIIPILTGWREEHVVADVAWSVSHYVDWTGDDDFLRGRGGDVIVECARYWAGRIREDRDGAHIFGVVGPDEYHEVVDDNAYTNAMARWNLRRAAELSERAGVIDLEEVQRWIDLADALHDGYDTATGIHEQFSGFLRLDRSLAAEMTTRPVMADELLGRLRVKASQIIKQPDVLMLHHLVPDDLEPGSLARDLDYYDPLTAHGSSLSPPIHAALLARAGRPDEALQMLSIACRLDLDDLTHTTGRGLHLATMGGVWQAIAHGFMGVRPRGETLVIDPVLASAWESISLTFRFRGRRVSLRASRDVVDIKCDGPVSVAVCGAPPITVDGTHRADVVDRGNVGAAASSPVAPTRTMSPLGTGS